MASPIDTEAIRQSALQYQWFHNKDWTQMAETGDPLVIVEGKGIRVTDSLGNTWIDACGGYYSVNVGYGRDEISYAAYEQLKQVTFFPNGTTTAPVIQLCQKLADITPGSLSRTFLNCGGSEANETALKITRAYHKRRGQPTRYKVISRRGSYHGALGQTMWLGESSSNFGQADFEPQYPGMLHAPHPNPYRCEMGGQSPSECAVRCAQAVEKLILEEGPETVAAFIGEPVAQPSGSAVPGEAYWPMIRDICDRYGVVMIVDEVITGFGRTGKMFGMEHWGVVPDIMTVGKGISSSYLPISGTIVSEEIADVFGGPGNQLMMAVTHSGHPVTAAAALKNIEIIETEGMVQNSAQVGAYFKQQLQDMSEDHPTMGNVDGLGLFMGIDLVSDKQNRSPFADQAQVCDRLNEKFQQRRLILHATRGKIYLGPPLCTTREDVDQIAAAIDGAIGDWEQELSIT